MKRALLLLVSLSLLTACAAAPTAAPAPSDTPTPRPSPTLSPSPTLYPTPTRTPSIAPTRTPEQPWEIGLRQIQTSETGEKIITLYDTSESVTLHPESIRIIETTDGLYSTILTAYDESGKKYAFNPEQGWFAVPENIKFYNTYQELVKPENIATVTRSFIEDGRAAIVDALLETASPTISPDAPSPIFWAVRSLDGNDFSVLISIFTAGQAGVAERLWPDQLNKVLQYLRQLC